MSQSIVPSARLNVYADEIRRRAAELPDITYRTDLLDDAAIGPALRNYILFTHWPELVYGDVVPETTTIYCNRLYWFARVADRMAGQGAVQDQLYELLEEAPAGLDWEAAQKIVKNASRP